MEEGAACLDGAALPLIHGREALPPSPNGRSQIHDPAGEDPGAARQISPEALARGRRLGRPRLDHELLADLELVAARVLDPVPVAEVLEPHAEPLGDSPERVACLHLDGGPPARSAGAGAGEEARATGRAGAGSFSTSFGSFFCSSPMRARATASLAGAPERRAMAVSGMTSSVPGLTRLPALRPFIWRMVAEGTP